MLLLSLPLWMLGKQCLNHGAAFKHSKLSVSIIYVEFTCLLADVAIPMIKFNRAVDLRIH